MAVDPRAAKLLAALDLADTGITLMRQNLRREHPDASSEEIERLLKAWIGRRPGAELGDAPGRLVAWPRP